MVKVIRYSPKRQVICKHCGALLEFEKDDMKKVQTGMNEFEWQIVCRACSAIVTIQN